MPTQEVTIHRYEPGHGKGGEYMGMEETPQGSWCAWEDVQALERRVAELEARASGLLEACTEAGERTAALERQLDDAIDLIVEIGGAIDGAIAAHLLPGVTGKNARALSLKSRKWLATHATAPKLAHNAKTDALQARLRNIYHLTINYGDDPIAALVAIRNASGPGA